MTLGWGPLVYPSKTSTDVVSDDFFGEVSVVVLVPVDLRSTYPD